MEKVKQYIDFMFEDQETEDIFLVEISYEKENVRFSDLVIEAEDKALKYFKDIKFIRICSTEEAEALGLDTY